MKLERSITNRQITVTLPNNEKIEKLFTGPTENPERICAILENMKLPSEKYAHFLTIAGGSWIFKFNDYANNIMGIDNNIYQITLNRIYLLAFKLFDYNTFNSFIHHVSKTNKNKKDEKELKGYLDFLSSYIPESEKPYFDSLCILIIYSNFYNYPEYTFDGHDPSSINEKIKRRFGELNELRFNEIKEKINSDKINIHMGSLPNLNFEKDILFDCIYLTNVLDWIFYFNKDESISELIPTFFEKMKKYCKKDALILLVTSAGISNNQFYTSLDIYSNTEIIKQTENTKEYIGFKLKK